MEDLLALGIASLAGYISVLGLPQKRATAKEKLQTVATNFAKVYNTSPHALHIRMHVTQMVALQAFKRQREQPGCIVKGIT